MYFIVVESTSRFSMTCLNIRGTATRWFIILALSQQRIQTRYYALAASSRWRLYPWRFFYFALFLFLGFPSRKSRKLLSHEQHQHCECIYVYIFILCALETFLEIFRWVDHFRLVCFCICVCTYFVFYHAIFLFVEKFQVARIALALLLCAIVSGIYFCAECIFQRSRL